MESTRRGFVLRFIFGSREFVRWVDTALRNEHNSLHHANIGNAFFHAAPPTCESFGKLRHSSGYRVGSEKRDNGCGFRQRFIYNVLIHF